MLINSLKNQFNEFSMTLPNLKCIFEFIMIVYSENTYIIVDKDFV